MLRIATHSKKAIIAWCFYDWAAASFSTVITTFIFATYFTQKIATDVISGTTQWGNAIALAGLIVAILSPFFGTVADYQGRRKPWLAICTLMAICAAALLWYAKPSPAYVHWTLIFIVIGTIGHEVGTVFYNAMIRDLVNKDYLGRLSGMAWGLGYVGGIICLSISLYVFIEPQWPSLNKTAAENIRICGPWVALWYFIFSIPLFIFTPDRKKHINFTLALRNGYHIFIQALKKLPQYQQILKFLLARMLYIDGLNTIFAFGGIYAAGTFGMSTIEIIKFGITMNISAGIGAVTLAWMDDYVGSKKTILFALFSMIIFGTSIVLVHNKTFFWLLALMLCLFVGPVQAASRSLLARIAPEEVVTEMFGLYNFSGRITAFIGPWLFGLATSIFGSQRFGVAITLIFLLLGAILLAATKINDVQ